MSWADQVATAYGDELAVGLDEGFGPLAVDVPAARWHDAVLVARDVLGCRFLDWLSAVDELDDGFRVLCHLARRPDGDRPLAHLLVRTLVPRETPALPSVQDLFAGAAWHERETHEMFGIDFTADGAVLPLEPLLLPVEFEGHPLRKDFVLASRVARPWPGAQEPGESAQAAQAASAATAGRTGRARRRPRPPGVPDEGTWGP